MAEPPNVPADVPNEKGKRIAEQTSSRSTSVLGNSAQTLLASFATPRAVTGSLSSATASANQQKTSPATSSRANLHYSGDVPGVINTSSSTSTARFAQELPEYKNVSAAHVSSSADAQRQFEEFVGSSASQSTANASSDVFYKSTMSLPAAYLDENDGDAVVAFLSSSHSNEAIYSPAPSTYHAPAPTHSQVGYNRILADIAVVEDPVEYLLRSCNYTKEVWGDDWAELQRAKQELIAGNKMNAQRRVVGVIGRLKARL
ncbi:uncharacterized protein V1513DRAFT_450553 [Lipomyces chichibuensis]|uniref:uncharacterized protein n=1 Tax=Lipomyces chichibuensis TaxID=1546026 RepID=UPI00334425E4